MTTFKMLRYRDSGELVPFKTLLTEPFMRNAPLPLLDKMGIDLCDNTEEQILSAVQEFLTFRDRPVETSLQKKARSLIKPGIQTYGSQGSFSETILKYYDHAGAL